MNIKWYAHSCFLLTLKNGMRILFDPFDAHVGYTLPEISTDILLVSHAHSDHNYTSTVTGDYKLIDGAGDFECAGVKITAIAQFHDKSAGKERGSVLTFKIYAEGITLLHMGDIGHVPDDDYFEKLGNVDILLVPVGGIYTIDPKEALEICKKIEPNIIVPMHYKTPGLTYDLMSVFSFTNEARSYFDLSKLGDDEFDITSDNLKKRSRIIVMQNSYD